jgi:hypothetical protein
MPADSRPALLFDGKYNWNQETLTEFAKESFRGFKEAYKGQVNAEKRAKLQVNEQTNRRAARRKEVRQSNEKIKYALTDPAPESEPAA